MHTKKVLLSHRTKLGICCRQQLKPKWQIGLDTVKDRQVKLIAELKVADKYTYRTRHSESESEWKVAQTE